MSNVSKLLTASGILAVPLAVAIVSTSPSSAQDTAAGRYTMHQTDEGMLRLDTQTGDVSLCSKANDAWACKPMADERATNQELERLRKENSELRAEVKKLDKMLGVDSAKPNGEVDPPRPGGEKHAFRLPSEKEVDQALNYFERMLRKFQDRLKKLEQGQGEQPKQL